MIFSPRLQFATSLYIKSQGIATILCNLLEIRNNYAGENMNKYNTHSDLKRIIGFIKRRKHYQRKIEKKEDFSIETYEFLEDTEYLKKKYIEFF